MPFFILLFIIDILYLCIILILIINNRYLMEASNSHLQSEISTEYFNDLIIEIKTSNNVWFKELEFFFNNSLWLLLWYIKIHLPNNEDEKNIIRIIDVTSASWYRYLSEWVKNVYNENWYDDKWIFIKWKASKYLSFVLLYINKNFRERNTILVSCPEKNKRYLEPVIDDVINRVGDIIWSVTWKCESSSFTINLK